MIAVTHRVISLIDPYLQPMVLMYMRSLLSWLHVRFSADSASASVINDLGSALRD
jgi:hypothetical protein